METGTETAMAKSSVINKLVRESIRTLRAYKVPSSLGLVKLDAMENPYGWPESMQDEWLRHLRGIAVNRYPDPEAAELKACLRERLNVPQDAQLVLGNGSDELIQIIQLCLAGPARAVLAPIPSFVMYEMVTRFVGAGFVGVPLNDDFSLDLDAMLQAIDEHQPSVIFLAYPNNPSGNLFDPAAVDAVINHTSGLVVIDEAYHIFAGSSYYDSLDGYDNLVVMRTLSKLGLAGLRLGVLAGSEAWLGEFEKVRMPYNINVLTQLTAQFALRHLDVFEQQAREVVAQRQRVFDALSDMEQITPYPSHANFILFRSNAIDANKLFQNLKDRGVLIKNLSQPGTLLEGCLRVTMGTARENDQFISALVESLQNR